MDPASGQWAAIDLGILDMINLVEALAIFVFLIVATWQRGGPE